MWPTERAAQATLVLALAAAVLGLLRVAEIASLGAALLAVVAVADAGMLVRRRRPTMAAPVEVRASLRRTYGLAVSVDGLGAGSVAIDLPWQLGGPLAAAQSTGRRCDVTWTATPRQRGLFVVDRGLAIATSPLRLWRRRWSLALTCRIRVVPDLRGPDDDSLGREVSDDGARAVMGVQQAGGELRALRVFQPGDDPRHVDWKATARAGHPIVREWQPDRRRSVVLAIDAGRLMRAEFDGENKLDAALRALLRLALAAEARGDHVGVLVYTHETLRWVPPQTGAGQAERLLRQVGDVQAQAVESDPVCGVSHLLALGRRSLVVLVTDVVDREQGEALTRALAHLTQRHLAIVALLRDPHLDVGLRAPIATARDAYRRAASEMVWLDRMSAVEGLRARGVHALDLSMRSIAWQVVQVYLKARVTARW